MTIRLKRIYEPADPDDGFRILVDRLWPRGISKERAGIDLWLKDAAPSPELRKDFCHDPAKWEEFRTHYFGELQNNRDAVPVIRDRAARGTVTLVYAAKDEQHNHALVLKEFLEKRKGKS